jgi:asparagine synthase (glutamine-hydrolysing)
VGAFLNAHGFVLQYNRADRDDPAASIGSRSPHEGTAGGARFRVFVRPFVTTPEAVGERQPIATPFVVLAYAGRIDNREDISHRLGRPGLRRAADGEILAEAYGAWGADFPAKVLGEYSFALIDRRSGQLVAGRDSLGIGRLFRCDHASGTWVASSLELLLDALPAWPSLDRGSLAEYFATGGLLSSGHTIFTGMSETPAAHVLVQSRDTATVRRYWQPDPERRVSFRRDEDYDEALRSLLFDAVRASLRSSTPVWSDLSGGLDSSSVLAAATLLDRSGCGDGHGLAAFSQVMSETVASDEGEFQREFLAAYPLDHHTVDVDAYRCFEMIDDTPSCHPSKATLYRSLSDAMSRLFAAHGVRAHLTGRGGDVLFCGDHCPPLHLAELVRDRKWGAWLRETRQWARQGERSFGNLVWHCSRGSLADPYAGREKGVPPAWLPPGFRTDVQSAESAPWHSGERLYRSPAREFFYRSIMYISSIARFVAVGDERHPLLYRPLVEFVLALPWEQLLRPDQDRVIQRRALRGILPEAIRQRRSKATATHLLLKGYREGWPRIRDLTKGRRLAALGLVEPSAFEAACERLRHGLSGKHLRFYVAALTLEMWLRANERHRQDATVDPFFARTHLVSTGTATA